MGNKRKRKDAESEDHVSRKIRKLERRIKRIRRVHNASSDTDYYYDGEDEEVRSVESEVPYYLDSDECSVRSVASVVKSTVDTANLENSTQSAGNQDTAVQGTSGTIVMSDPPLPSTILEILGESKEKEESFGPKIREDISKYWGKIIMEGLSKEHKQGLMENVLIPVNFQLLKAPKLNPEIAAVLSESTKNRDKRLEKTQNHLGVGIAVITNLMTGLIDGEINKEDVIKKLSEAGRILLDLHNRDTFTRRQLITYSLDKKFFSMVRDVKRDAFLFGENLGEKIKASKTAEQSGIQVKRRFEASRPSTSYRSNHPTTSRPGNASRGPPRQYNQRGKPWGPRNQISAPTNSRHPVATSGRYNSSAPKHNHSTRKTP